MRYRYSLLAMLLMALCVFSMGCTGLSGVAKQLKDDPAIVIVNVGSPWGQQKLIRIGGSTNSVAISPDGVVTINPKLVTP